MRRRLLAFSSLLFSSLLFSSLLAHARDAPADDSAIVVGEYLLVVDYNDDGTYRLLLPPELAEPPDETRGVVTWTYDGQESFPLEPLAPGPHPDYDGSGDMNVDLGVVILDDSSSFPSSVGVMTVSGAADSTLEALTNANNLAYPTWRDTDPYCYVGQVEDTSGYWGWYMVKDSGPVSHITNKKLGVRIDGGPGHSGSPIYYCPIDDNDVCADGEDGVVIGVWSGWYNGVTTLYNGGPKVPYYQSWILGELP